MSMTRLPAQRRSGALRADSGAQFALVGPRHSLRAVGVAQRLTPADPRSVAWPATARRALLEWERRTGRRGVVVGAIPFDPDAPAHLYIPEQVTRVPVTRESRPAGAASLALRGRAGRVDADSSLASVGAMASVGSVGSVGSMAAVGAMASVGALGSPAAHAMPAGLDALDELDDPGYRAAVAQVLARIRAEQRQVGGPGPDASEQPDALEKVVLARALDVVADRRIDVAALHRRLAQDNPGGYAYRVDLPTATGSGLVGGGLGGGTSDAGDRADCASLVGASPELLVAVAGDELCSNPLAGSAPRDPDPGVDEARRARLAASAKDAREHRHVVDAVEAALLPLTDRLDVPAVPAVSGTRDLWHLSTTITGLVRPGLSALDLARALHPTPAICGVPTARAAQAIADLETLERGYFAGLVGWVDSRGDGEWVIALRGGLVEGRRVRVHAGAGIVAGSDPDAEHAETATKMRTFLRALTAVAGPVAAHVPTPAHDVDAVDAVAEVEPADEVDEAVLV